MDCVFFGVQLVIDRSRDRKDHFGQLRAVVRSAKKSQTSAENADLHERVAACMRDLLPIAVSGYWDYIPDPSRAASEFRDWCEDIEWAESLTHKESPNPFRSLASGEYMIATVAYQILKGSAAAGVMGLTCDVTESDYWKRATFERLLVGIPRIDFPDVQSDAVYVVPGASEDGIPSATLETEGFAYLHPIERPRRAKESAENHQK